MAPIVIWVGLVALLLWLIVPALRRRPADPLDSVEPVDQEELEAAERELRADPDLDPDADPADDDWGPGAPGRSGKR
jgi:hypothetical protein